MRIVVIERLPFPRIDVRRWDGVDYYIKMAWKSGPPWRQRSQTQNQDKKRHKSVRP